MSPIGTIVDHGSSVEDVRTMIGVAYLAGR